MKALERHLSKRQIQGRPKDTPFAGGYFSAFLLPRLFSKPPFFQGGRKNTPPTDRRPANISTGRRAGGIFLAFFGTAPIF